MSVVRGESVLIEVFDEAANDYLSFACARGITINLTSQTIGKSTIGSGDWEEVEIVSKSWDFTIDGVVYLGMTSSLDTSNFIDIWNNKTLIQVKFFITDVSGNSLQMSGTGLITSVSINGTVNNVAGANITGKGTGELTVADEDGLMDSDGELMMDSDSILMTDL